MKHLLKVVLTLIAATLFTAASAQNGAFIKYDLGGTTILAEGDDLINYNNFVAGDKEKKANNEHVFLVMVTAKHTYKMDIMIHTPPHTNPVVGKLPFVSSTYKPNNPIPAVYVALTRTVGEEMDFYSSRKGITGYFEITKVADGWVEGKFEMKIPDMFEDTKTVNVTNGSFRFEIAEEVQY